MLSDCFLFNVSASPVGNNMASKNKTKQPVLFTAKDALSLLAAIAISIAAAYLFSHVEIFRGMGYIGIFIISLISSATVLLPLPGFAVAFAMGALLNPLLVGIVAGIGSGIGEITGYMAGFAGHDAVMETNLYKRHKKEIEKHGPIAIFILAFIPNPAFDIAGIASGALRMPWQKFLIATIAGKVLRCILLAYAGSFACGIFGFA